LVNELIQIGRNGYQIHKKFFRMDFSDLPVSFLSFRNFSAQDLTSKKLGEMSSKIGKRQIM